MAWLGSNGADVAFSAVVDGASVVSEAAAVAIAYTEVAFLVLSRHFFLWARLPCPGPGMLTSRVVTRLGLS
jgi:hypothetical protein